MAGVTGEPGRAGQVGQVGHTRQAGMVGCTSRVPMPVSNKMPACDPPPKGRTGHQERRRLREGSVAALV